MDVQLDFEGKEHTVALQQPELWAFNTCVRCGKPERSVRDRTDSLEDAPSCCHYCDECFEAFVSEEGYVQCEGCERWCDELRECNVCDTEACESCSEGTTCDSCGDWVCDSCYTSCQHCGDDICENCQHTCPSCEYAFCSGCIGGGDHCVNCEEDEDARGDSDFWQAWTWSEGSETSDPYKAWSLPHSMNVANVAADFYLLCDLADKKETLRGDYEHKAHEIAQVFSRYLDMVVGGELRHVISACQGTFDEPEFVRGRFIPDGGRSDAWAEWKDIREKCGCDALREAVRVFREAEWNSSYGGESWAKIAELLLDYLGGGLTDITFVDTAFGIQHNGGAVFDKMWDVNDIQDVLNYNLRGALRNVARYASKSVRSRWEYLEGASE